MPDTINYFSEKSGVVISNTEWGYWWQSVQEVHANISLPKGTRAKDLQIVIQPRYISCSMGAKMYFQGRLAGVIHPDESIWTIEDKQYLRIVLAKADFSTRETPWASFLDNNYVATEEEKNEVTKKMDLERFQMENPGLDFSQAKLLGDNRDK